MKLDTFTQAYLECALWSSTDNADESGGAPLDRNYDIADLAPATLESMKADCADFQASFGAFIDSDLARAGHDFWLTRNRHGAGFWDGDWSAPYARPEDDSEGFHPGNGYADVGAYLTAMAHPYGEQNLYVGDDGKLYL